MRIDNSFSVSLPAEDAWKVLLDVERIAPCMPGAELQEITDEEFRGIVKVKLGAITAQYKGAVRFVEVDEAGRRLVLRAEGRETRGQGNASATVTATLRPAGEGRTEVAIETDLTISGKIAQFGRGVLADVSIKLLADFARCVERDLLSAGPNVIATAVPAAPEFTTAAPTASEIVADEVADIALEDPERAAQFVSAVIPGQATQTTTASTSAPRTIVSRPAEPVDLLAMAGPTVAQRAFPVAIVGVFLLQGLVKGRVKRLGLAVVGSALVAGLVAGKPKP
jgi:carbon monoxide dehydrogenase subunit G